MDHAALDQATDALRRGELVVYPTETVYGLGADALDPEAIERVFDAKGRNRDNPISLAASSIEAVLEWTNPTERERRFMEAFLPGPVTVLVRKRDEVPDVLTGGRDRVGVRIPDHDLALALLERVAPITATSANVSGRPSVREVTNLDPEIRDATTVVLDGGETDGTESTVVDVNAGTVLRRGTLTDRIEAWLQAEE